MEDPRRCRSDRGSGPAVNRARSARHRAGGAGDDQAQLLAAGLHRDERGVGHRTGAVGHLRQASGSAGLAASGRLRARQGGGLQPPAVVDFNAIETDQQRQALA